MNTQTERMSFEPAEPDLKRIQRDASKNRRSVNIRCAAGIKPTRLIWLWPGWLAAGKLTVLAGDAGTGKTTLALYLASVISSGGIWPDGAPCQDRRNVLIWSGEDDAGDTIVPRLIAASADLDKCHVIDDITETDNKVAFDPAHDMEELSAKMEQIGNVGLLIIDPIVSAVAGDMHKANDVRRSLQPIVELASKHMCAVLGITHFAKGSAGRSPQDRVLGSQAFGALARMVLVTCKEENSARRVLARAKANIANDSGGIAYSIDPTTVTGEIETTITTWHGAIEGTAREILGATEQQCEFTSKDRGAAINFLRSLLRDGPLPANQVQADAQDAGFSSATIRRAKDDLGIQPQKVGGHYGGGNQQWVWSLPER